MKKVFVKPSNFTKTTKTRNPYFLPWVWSSFLSIYHSSRYSKTKHPACRIFFMLCEREVRLNVSCESRPSSMYFSSFLQNTKRTAWFMEDCILILSEWFPGYTSLSHVQPIVFSVMKPTMMIFGKLIHPSNETIDSHLRTKSTGHIFFNCDVSWIN